MGVPLTSRDPAGQLGGALRARGQALLMLDNLEQLEGAAALIEGCLEAAPALRVLATSRARQGAAQEIAVEVGPLSPLAAGELFLRRGRAAARPGAPLPHDIRREDLALIGALVQRLDRLPLAIELAAARLGALSLGELSRRLTERFEAGRLSLLRSGPADAAPRALRGALEWSWELLDGPAQRALARFSVFRGGFDLAAAEALSGGDGQALDLLEVLVEGHLLRRERAARGAPTRYGLFESIRLFAAEKRAPGDGAAERHARHYAALGEEARRPAAARSRRLIQELENLLAGAARGATSPAAGCALAAMAALEMQGPFTAGVALADQLLTRDDLAEPLRARLLQQRGRLLHLAGDTRRARASLEAALAAHRAAGRRDQEGVTLGALGLLLQSSGQMDDAGARLREALAAHREVGRRAYEGVALCALGGLDHVQDRDASARAHYGAALRAARAAPLRALEGVVRGNLGLLDKAAGRWTEAAAHFEAARAIHREVGNRRSEAMVLANQGVLEQELGRPDAALARYGEALAAHRAVGDRRGEASVLTNLGALCRDAGQLEDALEHLEGSLELHRALGNHLAEGAALLNLGSLRRRAGQPEDALRCYRAGRAIFAATGKPSSEGNALNNEALALKDMGRLDEADDAIQGALSAYRAAGNRAGEILALSNQSGLLAARGELDAARAALDSAVALSASEGRGALALEAARRELEAMTPRE